LFIDGVVDPGRIGYAVCLNAPMLRNKKWKGKVDEFFNGKNKNVWNVQAQYDFGLGSTFADAPWLVASSWDPFLHFADSNRSVTIQYEGPQSAIFREGPADNPGRFNRGIFGIQQHTLEYYQPPGISGGDWRQKPFVPPYRDLKKIRAARNAKTKGLTAAQKAARSAARRPKEKQAFVKAPEASAKPEGVKVPKATKSKVKVPKSGRSGPNLRAMFNALDKNNDGKLSVAEIKPLARRLNLTPAELMKRMDTNKDGFVSYAEFARFMR